MSSQTRKLVRLRGYDYGETGIYFVTVCTEQRRQLFWEPEPLTRSAVGVACGRPLLSHVGRLVEEEIVHMSTVYPGVSVDNYVVMPNHVHLLIRICWTEAGRPQAAPTLSRIMNQFKGKVTKRCGCPIWKKSFHDHIIRDEADYLSRWTYIETNPARRREDKYCEE